MALNTLSCEKDKPHVLLIYPGKTDIVGYSYQNDLPIGLLYVAAPLKSSGMNVSLFDMRIQRIEEIPFRDYLLVGITMLTGSMISQGLRVAKLIKNYNKQIPIVLGGVHPTLLAEQTLENELVDFVVMGEGEKTAQELALSLLEKGDLSTIKGLVYKDNGHVVINPPREFLIMDDLDYKLPFEILHQDISKDTMMPVHTSRGCPWRCSFCYNVVVHNRNYRKKSSEKVIEEIEYLIAKYGVRKFDFCMEDEFFIDANRVRRILEDVKRKNLKLSWSAFCRWDTLTRLDDDVLDLIRETGCNDLSFGAESGSTRLLDEIILKDIKKEEIIRGTERLKKARINHLVSFICCFPTETMSDIEDTLDLIEKITFNNHYIIINAIFLLAPIPGTHLYELVRTEYNYRPPKSLDEWGDFQMPFRSVHDVTWHDEEYVRFCTSLHRWSTFHPYLYLDPENAGKNKHHQIGQAPLFIYKMMGKLQRIRIKHKWFKYPIEHLIFGRIFGFNTIYKSYRPILSPILLRLKSTSIYRIKSRSRDFIREVLRRVLPSSKYELLRSLIRSWKNGSVN